MNIEDGSVEALVLQSVNDVREQRGVPLAEEPIGETVLFAPGGKLDPVGLVDLMILLEQKISDKLGAQIVLGDERPVARAQPISNRGSIDWLHFATVGRAEARLTPR